MLGHAKEMSVKSPNNSGSAYALVSAVKPYLVIEAGQDFGQQLGFTQQELVGRTLKILTGPESNIMLLESLFKGVDAVHDKQCRLIVYGKDGGRHDVEVSVSAAKSSNSLNQEHFIIVKMQFTTYENRKFGLATRDVPEDHLLKILQDCNQKIRDSLLERHNSNQTSCNQDTASPRTDDPKMLIGQTPLHLIASHARDTLLTVCSTLDNQKNASNSNTGTASATPDRVRLELVVKLAETEMIPKAERWEQRELAAGLVAVWRAVVRGAGRLLAAQLLAEQGA